MIDIDDFKRIINQVKFTNSLRQSDIAVNLGVTPTYLSDMLNGRVPITNALIQRLYEVYPYTENISLDNRVRTFKRIINDIKDERKLKQVEVAEMLGVTNPYLSSVMNGKFPLTENLIERVYEVFPTTKGLLTHPENEDDYPNVLEQKIEELKKRIEELEYTIKLQKKIIDSKK